VLDPLAGLDLTGQDPELVAGVTAARDRVRASPRDPAALFELAAVLDANDLDAPAEAAWEAVVAASPADAQGWYHLARVRERRGSVEGALEALREALARAPDSAPAHLRMGRILLETGHLEEAEGPLARALELDPSAPGTVLALARLDLLRDQAGRAIERLEPLCRRLPREPYVNGLLARAYAMRGDSARADACLEAEEHAGPPTARDPWQAEVQRRSLGMKVRLERARARLAVGDPEGAWEELAPLESRSDELVVVDAQCQVLLALGRPEEVLARLERIDPRWRQQSVLVVNEVLALRALGRGKRALEVIGAEVARTPQAASGHALMGEILFDQQRYEEAAAAYREARRRGDTTLATLLQLARARTASGDLSGGLGDLEEAARSFPQAPKPWAYRCEVLALEGRTDEARASLDEARRRGLEPELVARVEERLRELAEDGEAPR